MTYEEKKKVVEAANIVKENCEKCYRYGTDCEDCVFDVNGCLLNLHGIPRYWKIPKLTRWLPEDVALAKALKGFGITHLKKDCSNFPPLMLTFDGEFFKNHSRTVEGAFENLRYDERISIDTIIKEGEG